MIKSLSLCFQGKTLQSKVEGLSKLSDTIVTTVQPTVWARKTAPCRQGLTLVEVLVAMVILSLALLTYLTVTQVSDAGLSDGNEFTLASQAAGDQIAQAQGSGYSGLTNGTTTTTVPGLSGGQMTAVVGPLDGTAANIGIRQVSITVTWLPRKAPKSLQTTSLTETTLISNR